jgi:hypothetical protein
MGMGMGIGASVPWPSPQPARGLNLKFRLKSRLTRRGQRQLASAAHGMCQGGVGRLPWCQIADTRKLAASLASLDDFDYTTKPRVFGEILGEKNMCGGTMAP